ncbi:MAG TPA: hypothetical protein VLV89_08030 [Candidatus Acidoferrum sp.]|nr:hypothetical protein [Candidatus Acidoferrum sp.]
MSGGVGGGELWIAAVHLRKLDGCEILKEEAGAFTNAIGWASDENEFRQKVERTAAKIKLFVVEFKSVDLVTQRREKFGLDGELEELVAKAQRNQKDVLTSTFFTYKRDNA